MAPNMTFAVQSAADLLNKLDREIMNMIERQAAGDSYEKLSDLALNAANSAWHCGIWIYAEFTDQQRTEIRDLLHHNDGPDAAEHFVGVLSRHVRDLELCRAISVHFKHHTPTRFKIAISETTSSISSVVLTTPTGDQQKNVRIPKIVDGGNRHRVPELMRRVHSFWMSVQKEPSATINSAMRAKP